MITNQYDTLLLSPDHDSLPAPITPWPLKHADRDTTTELQSTLGTGPRPVTTIFTGHRLKPVSRGPSGFLPYQPDWVFVVFISSFVILAWVTVFYRKRLLQVIYGTFSKRHLSQVTREGNLVKERIALAMWVVYILSFSMVLYQAAGWYMHWNFGNFPQLAVFTIICGGLTGFWLIKIITMNLLSKIFKTGQTNHEYLLNIVMFSSLTGLVLLPMTVFMVYLKSEALLYVCFALVILMFAIRFIKGLLIGFSLTKFSYLFLFVYLCALELLPLAVLLKLVISYFAIKL
jgi:hypothetical protein